MSGPQQPISATAFRLNTATPTTSLQPASTSPTTRISQSASQVGTPQQQQPRRDGSSVNNAATASPPTLAAAGGSSAVGREPEIVLLNQGIFAMHQHQQQQQPFHEYGRPPQQQPQQQQSATVLPPQVYYVLTPVAATSAVSPVPLATIRVGAGSNAAGNMSPWPSPQQPQQPQQFYAQRATPSANYNNTSNPHNAAASASVTPIAFAPSVSAPPGFFSRQHHQGGGESARVVVGATPFDITAARGPSSPDDASPGPIGPRSPPNHWATLVLQQQQQQQQPHGRTDTWSPATQQPQQALGAIGGPSTSNAAAASSSAVAAAAGPKEAAPAENARDFDLDSTLNDLTLRTATATITSLEEFLNAGPTHEDPVARRTIDDLRKEITDKVVRSKVMRLPKDACEAMTAVFEGDLQLLQTQCTRERANIVAPLVEKLGTETTFTLIRFMLDNLLVIAQSMGGCIALPRVLAHVKPSQEEVFFETLLGHFGDLVTHEYGNFVVNHFASRPQYASAIIQQRLAASATSFGTWATTKPGSHVIEALFAAATAPDVELVCRNVMTRLDVVRLLAHDRYGNYCVQAIFKALTEKVVNAELHAECAQVASRAARDSPFAQNIMKRVAHGYRKYKQQQQHTTATATATATAEPPSTATMSPATARAASPKTEMDGDSQQPTPLHFAVPTPPPRSGGGERHSKGPANSSTGSSSAKHQQQPRKQQQQHHKPSGSRPAAVGSERPVVHRDPSNDPPPQVVRPMTR